MRTAERRELLAAVLAAGLAQALLLVILLPVLQAGRLTDIDGYSRLVRVQELRQTGAWYDDVDPRANAPFGVTSHWTRPLDALLLAGATLLRPFAEFEPALYGWGAALSPLLYLLTAAVLVWATRPVLEPRARLLMLLAFPVQFLMLMDSAPGMADHHALLLLLLAVTLGVTLRALPPPGRPGRALAAGALLALGLWISTEFVLAIVLSWAALGLGWILHGGHRAARNGWHALGLAAGVAVALLLERAPHELLALEADRISVLHLLPCLATLGFWTLCAATGLDARLGTRRGRALAAALAALPVGALLLCLARVGLAASARMDDPHVAPYFAMKYLQPLLPVDLDTTATLLICLGTALCAAPFLAATSWRTARTEAGEAWMLLAVLGLGQLVAALRIGRLAGHAELLMLVPAGALLSALLARFENQRSGVGRALLAAGVAGGLLLGPLALGAALIRWSPPTERVDPFRPSDLSALYPLLAARPGLGDAPLTILALPGDGPELLYRTPHRIVASPQHRGRDGIRDCLLFLDTADEAVARRIASERRVDLVIVPVDESWEATLPIRERSFISRCLAGDCPDWLRPLDTGPATGVKLFSVVRDERQPAPPAEAAQSGRR